MKVGFALLDKKGMDSQISEHFGECAYFMTLELDNGKISNQQIFENTIQHGAGVCQAVNIILQKNIDVMIAGGMGRNAQNKFTEAGVKLYHYAGTVKNAIDDLLKNKLDGIAACKEHTCE